MSTSHFFRWMFCLGLPLHQGIRRCRNRWAVRCDDRDHLGQGQPKPYGT